MQKLFFSALLVMLICLPALAQESKSGGKEDRADKAAESSPPPRVLGRSAGAALPAGQGAVGAMPMTISAPPTGTLGTMSPTDRPPIGTPPPAGKGPLGEPAKTDLPPK